MKSAPASRGEFRFHRAMFILTGATLVGAIALQGLYRLRETPRTIKHIALAQRLPATLPGWIVVDDPLGPSEASSQSALRTLNLDDYVLRRYQRGATWFSVYSAYWSPGKMPTRLVASHTPDRCWTENGMRCVEMKFRQPYSVANKQLLPAEYRAFLTATGEQKTYVVYWHLVDGQLYDYGERFNAIPHPWLWWKDTVAQAVYGSREQLFLRVTSNLPIEELLRDGDFRAVLSTVADWGLVARPRSG